MKIIFIFLYVKKHIKANQQTTRATVADTWNGQRGGEAWRLIE